MPHSPLLARTSFFETPCLEKIQNIEIVDVSPLILPCEQSNAMTKYTEQAPLLALASLPPPPRHHTLKQLILIEEEKSLQDSKIC